MTNPPSMSLQDYMLAYFRAGYPGTGKDPNTVTDGVGVKTQGGGGGATNATIVNPVDGSGNVKVAVQGTVTTVSNQVNQANPSTGNTGSATAPAANATIATLSLATGYYEIQAVVGFGGTAESTTVDNFQLKVNGVAVCNLPVANVANTSSQPLRFYVGISGTQSVTITAGGTAGSAGSIYKATVIATRQ